MRPFVMRPAGLFIFLLTVSLAAFQPAHAQQSAPLPVSNASETYEFGTSITFQAQISLPGPASEANLLFAAQGEQNTRVIPIQIDAQGNTQTRYDLNQGKVRPFSTISYQYQVKLKSGEDLTSQTFNFLYEDNRFTWQKTSDNDITIHWYTGDMDFGQKALDVARRGLKKASDLLLIKQSKPVDVYIYDSSADQTAALELGGLSSAGGEASPDLRVAIVSILPGPEQGLEMDQKIPHELGHIVTYDLMTDRYDRLPVWLREGIATQVELSANPDYPRALAQATQQRALMPISGLCGAFPPESGRSFLAYAEAVSFTRFVMDKFGQTGLLALTSAYGDGLNCEQGMQQALGQPLSKVEEEWLASSLGENTGLSALSNLFPYLAVLAVLLIVPLVSALTIRKS